MKNTIGLNPSDYVCKSGNRYRLKSSVTFNSQLSFLNNFEYRGKCLSISNNIIHVFDFIWDGMTGIHDGKKNKDGIPYSWLESCVHDALKFEKHIGSLTLSDKQIDLIFKEVMTNNKRWYRGLFYLGVRSFGWIFRKKNK